MKRVLIVDDDEDLLEVVCLIVASSNMSPKCILRGAEVFPCLEAEPFDLILMDIYLNDKDGRELARQLKQDARYSHIPIILYSAGNITRESIEQSLANDFLKKPFDMPVLIDRIRKMIVA